MSRLGVVASIVVAAGCVGGQPRGTPDPPDVVAHGALFAMMHEGAVASVVDVATLLPNDRLYSVGALADLAGEITVVAGVAHVTRPDGPDGVRTESSRSPSPGLGAALLVSAEVEEWLPVTTKAAIPFESLDRAIADLAREAGLDPERRLVFTVEGEVEDLEWHVIDGRRLPPGPSSHGAHAAASVRARRDRARATLVGFQSPSDMGTFTHMGSTTHVHCVVPEASSSGHVDRVELPGGTIVRFGLR